MADTITQPRYSIMPALVQAGRKWHKLAHRALAAHGISQARASALVWVHRLGGGTRQIVLASYVGIEGTSLVRLLDELGNAGLLERRDDLTDRRAKTIWLTPEGERLAKQIELVLATLRERVLDGVDQADIEASLRVCKAIDVAADLGCGTSAQAKRLLVADVPIEHQPGLEVDPS